MGITEIVLIVLGIGFLTVSFFVPQGNSKKENRIEDKRIKDLMDKEINMAKERIDDMVDETVTYSIERAERSLERISNEKMMALDEYSQTVFEKIDENHKEAVFLYDMLNDKDAQIKSNIAEINRRDAELRARDEAIKKRELVKKIEEETKMKLENQNRNKSDSSKSSNSSKSDKKIEDTNENRPKMPMDNTSKLFAKMMRSTVDEDLEEFAKKDNEENEPKADFVPIKPEYVSKNNSGGKVVESIDLTQMDYLDEAVLDDDEVEDKKKSGVVVSFAQTAEGKKNKNEEIRRLHDEGKSNMAIAKELGLGIGEVKLVIDLFSAKR